MPIVTVTECFDGYPLSALPQGLSALGPGSDRRLGPTLVRLQAFCELTGQTATGLDSQALSSLLNDFSAALFGTMFLDSESRRRPWNALARLRRALSGMACISFPCTFNRSSWASDFKDRVERVQGLTLLEERVQFWTGWAAQNADGHWCYLKLWRFHQRFGQERTQELYSACRAWLASGRWSSIPVVGQFSEFLAGLPALHFDDRSSIGNAISLFFPLYFRSGHKNGLRISTLTQEWRAFSNLLSDHLLGHSWALPVNAVPAPRLKKVIGTKTRLKPDNDGRVVKHTLITPIPLQVTDTEAKEILFREIRREVVALLQWARREIQEVRERLANRKALAPFGIPSVISRKGVNSGLHIRLSSDRQERLAHAAATFESSGFGHLDSSRPASLFYPEPMADTAWDLGIPTPALLLAHATVLVNTHPKITPTFLSELRLFDSNGHQVGLTKTDAGWYLRGTKRRRGPRLAQQEVLLTEETLRVVEDVIALTEPLRRWLRQKRNPSWRKLFLAASSMGTAPTAWRPACAAHTQHEWLARRFVQLGVANTDEARSLSLRFNLSRLRASSGVLIYIDTGSVERMAIALGHATWRTTLLDHYLPRPIQEFFTERWIRLFQTGLICEALTDSPYLLEASSFATMEELDTFLENHALRRVPAHLADPENLAPNTSASCTHSIVFCIEVGILTVLLSIEAAVRMATQTPCGRAMRWAQISERLVPHLESQHEIPEFHSTVALARRHADPKRVERLIYG